MAALGEDVASRAVMFYGCSRCALGYFCDQRSIQGGIYVPKVISSHMGISDPRAILDHYQMACGPLASLSGICNPWRICDGLSIPKRIDDLNEIDVPN